MTLPIFHWRLTRKLGPFLKLPTLVQYYSRGKVHKDGLEDFEKIRLAMEDRPTPRAFPTDTLALLQRNTLTWKEVKLMMKQKEEQKRRDDQRYLPERVKVLGPDLALVHFITFRGGKVKFKHKDVWMTYKNIENNEIPSAYVPDMYVEAVDASETELGYEGFENFKRLNHLKELILRKCSHVDDWCLHRLYVLGTSLERLDITGCHNVTERGICSLYSLKNLKTLVLNDTPKIENKELTCLLLQEIIPNCDIIGVDYTNPSLLDRLKEYFT